MLKKSFYYDFNGLRFSPFINQIEVLENGKKKKLSQIHCLFLLTLVENPKTDVTFDDLRRSIWLHEPAVDARLVRNIQSTKNHLVNVFRSIEVNADFIKPIAGKGYLLDADVTEKTENPDWENTEIVLTKPPILDGEHADVYQSTPPRKNHLFGEHAVYVAVSSLLYGLLFWIALLLEVAYQFDRFGTLALRLGFPIIFWIAATSFVGLTLTEKLIRRKRRNAFFIGLAFFVGGAILLCLAMSYFLPNEPITVARIQTQPAFAAYLKNSLLYFLPLGVIFLLMPFYFIGIQENSVSDLKENGSFFWNKGAINLRPAHFFGLWLLAALYSIFSTFYLLDNLLVGQYHNLFTVLIFLRFFIYFALGLICLIWYNTERLPERNVISTFAAW